MIVSTLFFYPHQAATGQVFGGELKICKAFRWSYEAPYSQMYPSITSKVGLGGWNPGCSARVPTWSHLYTGLIFY